LSHLLFANTQRRVRSSAWPARSVQRATAAGGLRGDEADLFRGHHHAVLRGVRHAAPWVAEAVVEDACLFAWLQLLRCQTDRDHIRGGLCTVGRREAWRLCAEARKATFLDVAVSVENGCGERGEVGPLVESVAGRETVEAGIAAREALVSNPGASWLREAVRRVVTCASQAAAAGCRGPG